MAWSCLAVSARMLTVCSIVPLPSGLIVTMVDELMQPAEAMTKKASGTAATGRRSARIGCGIDITNPR